MKPKPDEMGAIVAAIDRVNKSIGRDFKKFQQISALTDSDNVDETRAFAYGYLYGFVAGGKEKRGRIIT